MLTAGDSRQAIVEWRNWPLPVKLAAVVLVPVVFAVALSAVQIRAQVADSEHYEELGQVVDALTTLQPLIGDLQQERSIAVASLTGGADPSAVADQTQATDRAQAAVAAKFQDPTAFGSVAAARYADANNEYSQLSGLRQQVEARAVMSPQVIQSYGAAVQSLLALDQALSNSATDPQLSSIGASLSDLGALEEEFSQQQAWMQSMLANGNFPASSLDMLRDSQARMVQDESNFNAIASSNQQRQLASTLNSPSAASRDQGVNAVLAVTSPYARVPVAISSWDGASQATGSALAGQWNSLAIQLRDRANQLADHASDIAGLDSVILFSALLAATAVVMAVTRQLLRSLRRLRRSALEVAQYELPSAVAEVRGGRARDISLREIPIDTTEEVGQVARAFDEVNQQALRLALEQASLRRGFGEAFINVSRRSQSLLERQLLLFEELEQDEEDPDQLARLFQLDHLATRMRRNNENLMVLSGSDLARRFPQPVPIADVLRAAVSEIEQYPRVIVQSAPPMKLAGHVASDMVRLMAELLDNAANFSAPDTSVTVSSHQVDDDAVIVDVLDRGIGMTDGELADANAQLANGDGTEWAMSRRMGLLVAGRLASRHGVTVQLYGGREMEGVRATVSIPPDAIIQEAKRPRAAAAKSVGRNGFHHHDLPTSGALPQRESPSPVEETAENMFEPVVDNTPEPPTSRGLFEPTVAVADDDPRFTTHEFEFEPSWPEEEPPDPGPSSGPPTEWFQPTLEDARHQAQAQREYEQYGWPNEGPPVSEPTSWQTPAPDPWDAPQAPAPANPANPARHSLGDQQQQGRTSAGLPRRVRGAPATTPNPGRSDFPQESEPARAGSWSFAMDDARELAEAAASSEPTGYTAAGLPRRTPRARLAPGSVPLTQDHHDDGGSALRDFQRDPDRLRGRLSDFQSGVRRGRHSAVEDED
jgi:signal transduction histidine kinase